MKTSFIVLCLLLSISAFGQQKAKSNQKPPTQKDMNAAMKEAQGMLDEMMKEMSKEDRKMMDSIGIKMPDLKSAKMPAASDKQLAEAWEDEQRIVPKKDQARIASILNVPDNKLPAYISAVHKKVTAGLDAKIITAGNAAYGEIRGKAKTQQEAGNMALGFWVSGQPELAAYLLGKICSEDMSQTDNLSNYAAALTMLGGEQLAIPILQSLNRKFQKNSTILNNMGQAWFGLGDIGKAEKYLDSVLTIYPGHPQANVTKAAIEESKGNSTKAADHIKTAIRYTYTKSREEKLNQLGYKINRKDLRIPFKPGSDPLGLEQMRRPDYPTSIAKINALLPQWKEFNKDCQKKIEELQAELNTLTVKQAQQVTKMVFTANAAMNKGMMPALSRHPLSRKASIALQERMDYYKVAMKKMEEKYVTMMSELDAIRKKFKPADEYAPCTVHRDNINKLLEQLNSRKKIYDDEALHLFRLYSNDIVYWAQFTSTDPISFRAIQLQYLIFWLSKNRELQPVDMELYKDAYKDCEEKETGKSGKLSEFDEVACNYKTKMDFYVVKYEMNCSHTTITYRSPYQTLIEREIGNKYVGGTLKTSASVKAKDQLGPVGIEGSLGFDLEMELDENGKVIDWKGDAKAGVEVSVGVTEGPASLGAKSGAELVIEFGQDGVEDVIATHNAQATVGIYEQSVTIGMTERVSLISGNSSRTNAGTLKGIILEKF